MSSDTTGYIAVSFSAIPTQIRTDNKYEYFKSVAGILFFIRRENKSVKKAAPHDWPKVHIRQNMIG